MHKWSILLCFSIILFLGVVIAQESMTVETDIFVPEGIISIEVPDYIYVGNLTWGFETETDDVKIYVNNTGTVDVEIIPELANPSEDVFSYLHFAKRIGDGFSIIGNWSLNVSAPANYGGYEDEWFYMKLDLSNYEGDFDSDLNHQAQIDFIAVEQ